MDARDREMPETAGDLGGNDAALVAEYDLAESPGPQETAGTPLSGGGHAEESSTKTGLVQSAEAGRIDIRGAVAMARAQKATVTGVSVVSVGDETKVKGIAPLAVAGQTVKIKKAGSLLAVSAQDVEVGDRGFVAFALSPRVHVGDGGRVLIGAIAAGIAGLAFGLGIGLAGLLGVRMVGRMVAARRH